jgi:hypothetical protein
LPNVLQVDIPKSNIELWWPAGHGPQKLYDAVATWHPAGGLGSCSDAHIINTDDPAGIEDASSLTVTAQAEAAPLALQAFGCSEAKRQVGFRTVELVTVPLAEAAKELAPGTKPATGDGTEGKPPSGVGWGVVERNCDAASPAVVDVETHAPASPLLHGNMVQGTALLHA